MFLARVPQTLRVYLLRQFFILTINGCLVLLSAQIYHVCMNASRNLDVHAHIHAGEGIEAAVAPAPDFPQRLVCEPRRLVFNGIGK